MFLLFWNSISLVFNYYSNRLFYSSIIQMFYSPITRLFYVRWCYQYIIRLIVFSIRLFDVRFFDHSILLSIDYSIIRLSVSYSPVLLLWNKSVTRLFDCSIVRRLNYSSIRIFYYHGRLFSFTRSLYAPIILYVY